MNVEIVMEMVLQKIVQVLMNVKIWTVTVIAVEQRLLMNVVIVVVMGILTFVQVLMNVKTWTVTVNVVELQLSMIVVSVVVKIPVWIRVVYVTAMDQFLHVAVLNQLNILTAMGIVFQNTILVVYVVVMALIFYARME